MEYFWKKKTIVSFVLSIFVFWIHIPSFGQYLLTSGQSSGSGAETLVSCLSVFFSNTFVRMAVPLFFILSGAAFFRDYTNKKFVSKLKSRFWSLILPYLIWNTLGMIFAIITSYSFISRYFVAREKFVITIPNILKSIFFAECNGPFWFICSLIVFVFLSPLLELLTKNKIISFISIVVLVILSQFDIPFLSTLIHGIDSLIYYFAGCIIGRHFMKIFSRKCPKRLSVIAIFVFVLCTVIWFIRGMGIFELPVPLSVVFLSVFAMSFWCAFDIFDVENIRIRPFVSDSFFIYAMHLNLSAVIAKLLYIVLPKNIICAIPNFVITSFLTAFIILLFASVLRRFLNPLYLVLSGMKKRSVAK